MTEPETPAAPSYEQINGVTYERTAEGRLRLPTSEPPAAPRTDSDLNLREQEWRREYHAGESSFAEILDRVAARPALDDVERLAQALADEALYIEDDLGDMLRYDVAARRILARLAPHEPTPEAER